MKNALMIVSPNKYNILNIGDYIQALAAQQYLGHIDVYIDRDYELSTYNGDPVNMIMNGWYMDHPENFPPSDKIHPFYIAVHINKLALPEILRDECIEHFKKYQPIGCRDYHTVELLKDKGIDAYFSGCLTLTLGKKYKWSGERKGIYMVEPYFSTYNFSKRPKMILKAFCTLITNYSKIKIISSKKKETSLRALLHNSIFFREYRKCFDEKILLEAEYISQANLEIAQLSVEERFDYAKELIQKYSKAKLVITSRIHCGLPCLGLETPVIYTLNKQSISISTDRFGGLIDLFNVIEWNKDSLNFPTRKKITIDNIPQNKNNWKIIAEKLYHTVKEHFK